MRLSIRITLALGAVAVAIPFSPAWPWGSDGHRTIGMVADLLLQNAPASRDAVSQILGGISLSEASVFADCAKAGGRANAHSQLMSRTMCNTIRSTAVFTTRTSLFSSGNISWEHQGPVATTWSRSPNRASIFYATELQTKARRP